MRILFPAFFLMLLGFSCQRPLVEETTKDYSRHGDTLVVAEHSPLAERIKTSPAEAHAYSKEISTAAIVKVIPTRFAQIAPQMAGRIMKSHVFLGQKVGKNTPLFELNSPEFTEAQKEFFQSRSAYHLAQQTFNRQQDLIENGVGTKRDLEEAEHAVELALQDFRTFSEALRSYNADPKTIRLGQHLVVHSPIAGEIIENNLVVGQYVKEDADPVALVADLSKIWISAQVKEKDIRHLQKNDEVEILVGAYPDLKLKGNIFHIQEMMNEDTRSIEVLIECDNPSSGLKQGMFVTAKFKNQAQEKIMLPLKAVLQEEETAYVFVQEAKDRYLKRNIQTGDSLNEMVVIESGIQAGEIIVSQGAYFLQNTY